MAMYQEDLNFLTFLIIHTVLSEIKNSHKQKVLCNNLKIKGSLSLLALNELFQNSTKNAN